jgi:AraC-like DNA-binding protein
MSMHRHDFAPDEEDLRFGSVAYISVSRFERDWPSYLHTHDLTELFYVIDGEGEMTVESRTLQVKANELLLIEPNTRHREISSITRPLEYLVVGIRNLRIMPYSPDISFPDFCTVFSFARQQRTVRAYYGMISDELHHPDGNSPRMLRDLVDLLLVHLLRNFDVRFVSEEGKYRKHDCIKTRAYIDAHFKEPLTLDLLSEATNTSKFYLAHSFSREYGKTPMQYLTERRMAEAESLLKNTDMPVASVAETVGYSSASYFTQVFRARTGKSPRAWRAEN